jgi:UPF0271 protein
MRSITINSDMGESIGIHSFGNDDALLPFVDTVNIACGMHAGDPSAIAAIIGKAVAAGVTVGAHPGLPDLVGFGRREMVLDAREVRDLVRYQVGSLTGFLDDEGASLDHIKPHGALFGMMARDAALMNALCDVAVQYGVPVYGLAGTEHERVALERDVPFVSEYYVDLDYTEAGLVVVNKSGSLRDLAEVEARARRALIEGRTETMTGVDIPVRVESFCIHSDLPNAPAVAARVRAVLEAQAEAELPIG